VSRDAQPALLRLQQAAGNRATGAALGRRRLLRSVESIERELGKRFASEDDPLLLERRRALRGDVGTLSADDAKTLITRLFEPVERDALAAGFQRMHSSTRAELLRIAFERVEHLFAEGLHTSLVATNAQPWQRRLRSRLAELIPGAAERRKALAVLGGRFKARHALVAGQRVWVRLDETGFRNRGAISPDNNCDSCNDVQLGIDPATGHNFMELRGDIAGDATGIAFDFKRTMDKANWVHVDGKWKLYGKAVHGADDDKFETDEDLTSDGGHLFQMDGPGPPDLYDFSVRGVPDATGYVYMASFTQWVEAIEGTQRRRVSDEFEWHSVTTLIKVNGRWRRNPAGPNEIEPGPVPLISPDGVPAP
jgi:hypothetical protein